MTIHYHGTPITPVSILKRLAGCHFCVSFGAPQQAKVCHEIGQSCMLDNGAFSIWQRGGEERTRGWKDYYDWADEWLNYPTTWAVIPDTIAGTADDNDTLLKRWPHEQRGAPVWHYHEPISRLLKLCDEWGRVCFGSSGGYSQVGTEQWHRRTEQAFNELSKRHKRLPWLHMLRGMSLSGSWYPFASVDSTDIARNHHLDINDPRWMANRWDSMQCPSRWDVKQKEFPLFDAEKAS